MPRSVRCMDASLGTNAMQRKYAMTEEEKNELTEKINTYWQNRPKAESGGDKTRPAPIHDFDNLEFTSEEHVQAVREYYKDRWGDWE